MLLACLTLGCENRISSTEQCLGNGGITASYRDYVFEVQEGPALDVAGDCHVILQGCTLRAPEGIRVREGGRVEMRGGRIEATAAAIDAADRAQVKLHGVELRGSVRHSSSAVVEITR